MYIAELIDELNKYPNEALVIIEHNKGDMVFNLHSLLEELRLYPEEAKISINEGKNIEDINYIIKDNKVIISDDYKGYANILDIDEQMHEQEDLDMEFAERYAEMMQDVL